MNAVHKRIVVGITGASGAAYARRLIGLLVELGHEVHIACTPVGVRLLHDELGMEGVNINALAGLPDDADARAHGVFYYPPKDVGANIASGSFRHDGMIVLPCSSNTLNRVASGMGDTLVARAASVALKERRLLILAHRESPLTLIDIESMKQLTLAGAIVAPANPGFYLLPTCVGDIIDFMVGRYLDLLGIDHPLNVRWEQSAAKPRKIAPREHHPG